MKKKRGLKRYFNALKTKEFSIKNWLKDGYFAYDKLWVDNYGLGNFSLKRRKPHLDCLIRNFYILENKLKSENKDFQIWIWINEFSSDEDCIILHSQNPFCKFPHKYNTFTYDCNFKNKDLVNYLAMNTDFEKIYGIYISENDKGIEKEQNFCVLYKVGIGESII